jgi:hydrogenase nickel incorporation protein HypB
VGRQEVIVKHDIRAEQRAAAERFRRRMSDRGTFVVRLLSSPGSGKTTLLEKTAQRLGVDHTVGVLVGDVETDRDAVRLAPYAATAQITTGGACHLELPLVERRLPDLGDKAFDFLFIEDIGNLICPASHDLGEHVRVVVLSTTEGDDKPGKYPKAFRTSSVTVISKLDLLPHVPFSVERAVADAARIQPGMRTFPLCALSGEGVTEWCDFLTGERERVVVDAGAAQLAHNRQTTRCT